MLTWCTARWPWLKYTMWTCWNPGRSQRWCQVRIQAVKRHLHKELFNCPEALWELHLSLYPFNISYAGPSHALAKCLCPGCWNMDESAHLPIYLDVSRKHLSPHNLTSAHLSGPRVCLLEGGGRRRDWRQRKIDKKILQTGASNNKNRTPIWKGRWTWRRDDGCE